MLVLKGIKNDMKRNLLVVIETILIMIIAIGTIIIIFSGYYIFNGFGKSIVTVRNNNKEKIEYMLKESEYYDKTHNINDLKRIEFFMNFNDYQFSLYYKNNEKIELYDDNLTDLKDYIEEKGYRKSTLYLFIDAIIIILCICINRMRKKISNEIDCLDINKT